MISWKLCGYLVVETSSDSGVPHLSPRWAKPTVHYVLQHRYRTHSSGNDYRILNTRYKLKINLGRAAREKA